MDVTSVTLDPILTVDGFRILRLVHPFRGMKTRERKSQEKRQSDDRSNINVRWFYGFPGLVSEASVAHFSSPVRGVAGGQLA